MGQAPAPGRQLTTNFFVSFFFTTHCPFGVGVTMRVGWMLLVSAGLAILADLPKPSRASELRRMMASPEWKEAVQDG